MYWAQVTGWEPGCHHAFSVFGWDYAEVPPALCPIPPTAHTYLTLAKSTSVVLKCPQDRVCLLPLRAQSAGPVPSKIILPGLALLRYQAFLFPPTCLPQTAQIHRYLMLPPLLPRSSPILGKPQSLYPPAETEPSFPTAHPLLSVKARLLEISYSAFRGHLQCPWFLPHQAMPFGHMLPLAPIPLMCVIHVPFNTSLPYEAATQ